MRKVKLLVLFVSRALGLFHVANWATRHRLKILCYHGFALIDEATFRPKLFIRPVTFESRIAILNKYRMIALPLDEAVERLYEGTLPAHALAITIDDGFHSVHRLAAPTLQRHGLPATVYVTTYYVEHRNPIFRLTIQYMFWKTSCSSVFLRNVPWSRDIEIDLTDHSARERAAWECIQFGETRCTEEERVAVSQHIGALLEVPYAEVEAKRILHLMTPEELLELGGMGIDIQLHTHRHVFPEDDKSRACSEISDNKNALGKILGNQEFQHFCYPSGLWNVQQWAWLDEMGLKSATTCVAGPNTSNTPRHALCRFLDGENIHPLEFEAAISGFSDLLRMR